MDHVSLTALPFPLIAEGPEGARWQTDGTSLEMTSAAKADLFVSPLDAPDPLPDAQRLVGQVSGPFQFSARITVDFRSRFDAGVLFVHAGESTWLKLCFEFSPADRGMVVSVVTRGESDDANCVEPGGDSVYLRVSRLGDGFALHWSADGSVWELARACSLKVPADQPVKIGFLAQSPTGDGCRAVFDDIAFTTAELGEIRDGS